MSFEFKCSTEDQEFRESLDLFSDVIIIYKPKVKRKRSTSIINNGKWPLWFTFSKKSRLWSFSLELLSFFGRQLRNTNLWSFP